MMKAKLIFWSILVTVLIACGGSTGGDEKPAPEFSEVQVAALQAALDGTRQAANVPGAQLAVVADDGRVWSGMAGLADVEAGEPVGKTHRFKAASITKTFVAAAIVQLAAEGTLGLDDTINAHVPGLLPDERITIRHCLNHASGIVNNMETPALLAAYVTDPDRVWAPEEQIAESAELEPYFEPGTYWHYSNTNYFILGMVLETVTGERISATLRKRFFDPQGLDQTWFGGEEDSRGEIVLPYFSDGSGGWTDPPPAVLTDWSTSWAAGSVVSSAHDLAVWAQALYSGEELGDEATAQMLRFGIEPEPAEELPSYDYGLGVMRRQTEWGTSYGHSGSLPGYASEVWYLPERGYAVAVMHNLQGGARQAFLEAVMEVLEIELPE